MYAVADRRGISLDEVRAMPLNEFVHWCAFLNMEAYDNHLNPKKDELLTGEDAQRDFFKKHLLGQKPK